MRPWSLALTLALVACGDKDNTGPKDSGLTGDEDGDGFVSVDAGGDDCDDTTTSVRPDAIERCDGVDNNCDGQVDEGLTSSWYSDADGDGFGDSATMTAGCFPTETHTTQVAGDCDDADPFVHPAGTETCDGRDNDCNGQVDDPSMFDYETYYADTDGDTYGDATVYPGAEEDGGTGTGAGDGLDNDCNGAVDDNLRFGTGADGPFTVTNGSYADIGGACVEAWSITGADIVVSDASAFAPGDRAMVISLEGRPTETENVGRWTLVDIGAVDSGSSTLTALSTVSGSFAPDNSQLRSHSVAVLRVPQVTDLDISGTFDVDPFDGDCGGVFAVLASGTVTISGTLDGSGAGYEGGGTNTSFGSSGRAGESLAGRGDKGTAANGSGGGGGGSTSSSCADCTGSGGGGGHAEDGLPGESSNDSIGRGGDAGGAIGSSALAKVFFGGGGGSGALDTSSEGGQGGSGGTGGGIVFLRANALDITGLVDVSGMDGEAGCGAANNWCGTGATSEAGSGGGGAGGSIFLVANTLTLGENVIDASGGAGAESSALAGVFGGDGSFGRVRLDYATLNGYAFGSEDAQDAANAACTPNPGYMSGL